MRTMHFVRYFQGFGPVDIAFTFREPDSSETKFNRVLRLRVRSGVDFKVHALMGAVMRRPFPVYLYKRNSRREFAAMVRSGGYDVVLIRSLYPTGLIFELQRKARTKVLLDLDDRISGTLYDQTVQHPQDSRSRTVFFNWNRFLLERHERRSVRNARVTFVCSEADRERLSFGQRNSPVIVPNIYRPPKSGAINTDTGFWNQARLLFVGTLDYPPNIDGLRWFLQEVFPVFRQRHPEARLSVVGRNPTAAIRSLCEASSAVDLWADVPDILSHYESCRAVVVPLLSGGGTRIKILEAASAKRPVLSTRVGGEGLDFVDRRDLMNFENAPQFLAAYEELSDPTVYNEMVENAHEVVSVKYSQNAFEAAMTKVTGGSR